MKDVPKGRRCTQIQEQVPQDAPWARLSAKSFVLADGFYVRSTRQLRQQILQVLWCCVVWLSVLPARYTGLNGVSHTYARYNAGHVYGAGWAHGFVETERRLKYKTGIGMTPCGYVLALA